MGANRRVFMAQATHAAFDVRHESDAHSVHDRKPVLAAASRHDVKLSIHGDLSAIEHDWRAFEKRAACTAFQTFDWMACWYRNVGVRKDVKPAIVAARDEAGQLLFILPLAVDTGGMVRRLTWFATDLCDYNAPLLVTGFSQRIESSRFLELWRDILGRLQSHPDFRYDLVHFEKMPAMVGTEANPMLGLPMALNPSNAYLTHLSGDWEGFYTAKRSSATRRRDRTKRKRLAESGEVRFVDTENADQIVDSLNILMGQKARSFAAMGVGNIFARPGYTEFYRDIATTASCRSSALAQRTCTT
jgi:CelD/BcsL family acetyltransferase involved in cellulose biosynthesis